MLSVLSSYLFGWVECINCFVEEQVFIFIFFPMLSLLTLTIFRMTKKLFAELWWKMTSQLLLWYYLGIWWRPRDQDQQLLTNHPIVGWGIKLTKDDNQQKAPWERISKLLHSFAKVSQGDPPIILSVKNSAQYLFCFIKALVSLMIRRAQSQTWMHQQDLLNPLGSHAVCWSSDVRQNGVELTTITPSYVCLMQSFTN